MKITSQVEQLTWNGKFVETFKILINDPRETVVPKCYTRHD